MSSLQPAEYTTADLVLRTLSRRRHTDDLFLTQVKTGPTIAGHSQLRIMDGLALAKSWAHPMITGYEVKVSRQDWLRDQKWPEYVPLCHEFCLVCPPGIARLEELPPEVGLIHCSAPRYALSIQRKAIRRDIELPVSLLYYVCISRVDSDRHPFFSSRREWAEAWVRDKAVRDDLAMQVSLKLVKTVHDANDRATKAESKARQFEEGHKLWNRFREIAREYGIAVYEWDWEKPLRRALAGGLAESIAADVQRLAESATRLAGQLRQRDEKADAAVGGDAQ